MRCQTDLGTASFQPIFGLPLLDYGTHRDRYTAEETFAFSAILAALAAEIESEWNEQIWEHRLLAHDKIHANATNLNQVAIV